MKKTTPIERIGVCLIAAALVAGAQTQADLATQAKRVNFSAGPITAAQTGTALPATCTVGEIFYNTAAPAGENLYGCTATNVWSLEGGGIAAAAQLLDFGWSKVSNTVATIGSNCSAESPCVYRFGGISNQVSAAATATIGKLSRDTAYVYLEINNTPALTVGFSGAAAIKCSAGCTAVSGITGFPTDGSAIPLFSVAITANAGWASNVSDARSVYSKEFLKAGQSIVVQPSGADGSVTVQTDSTVVPRYFTGSGAPPTTCTAGRDLYTDTTNHDLFFCDATNVWKQSAGVIASGTAALKTSSIASGTCASAVTVSAAGVTAGDVISWNPNGDISAATGYGPSVSGRLYILPFPASGSVNFKVCNPTASAITPGAVTLNWKVTR